MTMTNEVQTQEQELPIEPNWGALRLLMDQARNWMWMVHAFDQHELQTIDLAYELLFDEFESDEAKRKRVAFRVTRMVTSDEDLEKLLYPPRSFAELMA
jgi:hypothetical protein